MNATNIKAAKDSRDLRKKDFRTYDIIRLVNEVERTDRDDVELFARQFPPNMMGLRRLFNFVHKNIRYKEDPDGSQWVQTPSHLWQTRVGDCKSYTVFISAVLHYMGLDRMIRYVSYDNSSNYSHVYPIAILPSGKKVVMDVVLMVQQNRPFGSEKRFTNKKDYIVKAGLYKLGNTQGGMSASSLADLEAFTNSIPSSVINEGPGDLTNMTEGQFDLYLLDDNFKVRAANAKTDKERKTYSDARRALKQGSVAGIGSLNNKEGKNLARYISMAKRKNKPAFASVPVQIPTTASIQGIKDDLRKAFFRAQGLYQGAIKSGDQARIQTAKAEYDEVVRQMKEYEDTGFIKKVVNKVKEAIKLFINWFFKGPAKFMGPYFIFLWIAKGAKKTVEIARRKSSQQKVFGFISKVSKIDEDKLKKVIATGIHAKTGMTPDQVIETSRRKKISGDGGGDKIGSVIAAVLKAVSVLVEVIKKIVQFFKKNKAEAGEISGDNASDVGLLAGMDEEAATASTPTPDTGSGGGGGILAIAAGIAALAIAA